MTSELPVDENEDIQTLEEWVQALNEKLREAGSVSSEQAFAMGCGLGLGPIVIILVLLLVLGVINIILAFTLAVMAVLMMVGVGMLLASTSRTNTIRRVYRDVLAPEIHHQLARRQLTRQQFDTTAAALLAEGAPLKAFLPISAEKSTHQSGVLPVDQE